MKMTNSQHKLFIAICERTTFISPRKQNENHETTQGQIIKCKNAVATGLQILFAANLLGCKQVYRALCSLEDCIMDTSCMCEFTC